MREIVLDTETTGLDPNDGHRMVEIGAVEVMHGIPTGNVYHQYINPERDMPEEAFRVHGISSEFLKDKPTFSIVVHDFLKFVANDPLVIHNAAFDMKFINYELWKVLRRQALTNPIVDTLKVARKKFPGQRASLDALCSRFEINNAHREKHGALLDAELLAEVYIELNGGRQIGLLADDNSDTDGKQQTSTRKERVLREARPHNVSAEELELHTAFLKKLTNPLWAS